MKRTLFSVALCLVALCASAQSYEVRTLTFEDADYRGSGNVVGGMDWSSLIDDAEYNGTLLYGDGIDTYMWYDENNTELVWDGLQGNAYWSGGAAVSNYYEQDLSQGDYTRQLSIPLAASTNQFIVVFSSENLKGYPSYSVCTPFYFADDKARVIESVDVINTTYVLNSLTNGDSFASAATDASQFVVHFVGTHDDGTTSEVTYLLADGRNFVEDWTTVDLTSLGEVKSLRTYVTGSDDLEGDWGLNTPGYVALDNIKVRFESDIVETIETVEITLNAKTKLIKSLVNMETGVAVEVGEPTSNKYTFDVPHGSYLLTATAADGTTVSGTIQLDVDAEHTSFSIYSVEVRVKNSGWVYGTDYTFDLKVTTKEGDEVNTTIGDYTSGNKMFLVFSGNTYYLDVIPSEARQAEGYLPATYSGTVTFNPTVQAEVPMSVMYSVTVPAEATFFLGTKTAHFVKFKEVAPESVTTEGEGKVYTFKLADKQVYNYRVSQEGKYTQGGLFTMSTDETKRPELVFTDADMEAKDPKYIDHDVNSNSKYNVGDLFLNINPAGHLQLANVGDTYDILPMRNWQLIESITGNYFIDPDFHFTVVNLNGQEDNTVVKVEDELLTAVGTGTAIVLVTYDAIHLDQYSGATKKDFVGGSDWGAIWPENTGVFVVTVGEQASGITPNMTINADYLTQASGVDTKMSMEKLDAEFDVLYYLDTEDGFDYTFTPEGVSSVTLARPVIGTNAASYTGFSAEGVTANDDGSYTVRLTMGRNIVCLTGADGKSLYQVITVKPCHREIKVGEEVVESVKPGDAVTVQYSGLYHPAGKLAGIHNFNAFLDYKQASEGISVIKGKGNQYTMAATATAQAVTFTVPEDWTASTIELTDGVMGIGGFGDPVGNHRFTSKTTGRAPNFTAISQSASLGRVPALELPVELPVVGPAIATFEDITDITEPVDGHMSVGTEDDDEREFFTSGDYAFASGCMSDWGYWYWFGYANRTGTKYETLDDQWNNVVGGGYDGSETYGVAFAAAFNGPCYATLLTDEPAVVPGFYITNSSYAYTSMTGGDPYAKKFEKGDWFKLTITGYDADDEVTGTKEYYLADLRDAKKAYIIDDWRYVDLSGLGAVAKLGFELTSSDTGAYGMNTPGYFCFDNFGAEGEEVLPEKNVTLPLEIATFEDITDITEPVDGHMSVGTEDDDERTEFVSGDYEFASGCMSDWDYWYWFGYANRTETKYETLDDQWNNVVGGGYNGSETYGVAFAAEFNGPCYVTLLSDEPAVVPGFYITNSAYAYNSLTGGDSFAKKFDKGDWFKLTITGYDADDEVTGTKDFYLADLRDEATAYIINDWRYVDLSCLGAVAKLGFTLSSTDNGDWGMKTPAYFCFDNFGAEGEEVLPESNVVFVSSVGYATYVAKNDIDFSETDVEAYSVTESTKEGYVHLTPIDAAPTGEAVLLKAEEGAYVLPVAASTPAALEGNLLKPAVEDVVADGTQYILADGTQGVAFYQANAGTTIAAGKGYLEFTDAPVKVFCFDGGDATGISDVNVNLNDNDLIYNIAGQRLQKMQRGINIINGKKVLR
ncbi:MAG: DUF4465 domain-containing protein [Bacteroidaceae bacterium]|nr:DUF4465 domain-containing protein [Bacteroidaceae bacterium]